MAMDARVIPIEKGTAPGSPPGAQCPSCFTFNLLRHLPENRKSHSAAGVELTCALCGARYKVRERTKRAA